VDQEVGGSSPPSCTSENRHFSARTRFLSKTENEAGVTGRVTKPDPSDLAAHEFGSQATALAMIFMVIMYSAEHLRFRERAHGKISRHVAKAFEQNGTWRLPALFSRSLK
jgi:hypothetical protein